jgi:ADP-heptose:LPS heptosyltransferase
LVSDEIASIARLPFVDFPTDLVDFLDTASLVDSLDLIISVDTSMAHLAGAMAKPVWLLSRYDACWRWLMDRTDSPWYPTMRIFRQPRPGDWATVISQVKNELEVLCLKPSGRQGAE